MKCWRTASRAIRTSPESRTQMRPHTAAVGAEQRRVRVGGLQEGFHVPMPCFMRVVELGSERWLAVQQCDEQMPADALGSR